MGNINRRVCLARKLQGYRYALLTRLSTIDNRRATCGFHHGLGAFCVSWIFWFFSDDLDRDVQLVFLLAHISQPSWFILTHPGVQSPLVACWHISSFPYNTQHPSIHTSLTRTLLATYRYTRTSIQAAKVNAVSYCPPVYHNNKDREVQCNGRYRELMTSFRHPQTANRAGKTLQPTP